jgi:hypothetical protein
MMHPSLSFSLLSRKFTKIWVPTVAAVIFLNFAFIAYRNDVYSRFRRTKWNPPVEYVIF